MAHVEYEEWVKLILGCYSHSKGSSPKRILELGCGTGNISSLLVRRGFNVDATDISEDMLEIARSKPFPANYSQSNMLDPLDADKYDLILLLFDSINYLTDPVDLEILLTNTERGLKGEGLFIFDISTHHNCMEYFNGFIDIEDSKDGYLIYTSDYDEHSRFQRNQITFFLQDGEHYRRFDEKHRQRIYRLVEILEVVEKSCYKLLGIYRLANGRKFRVRPEEYSMADDIYDRLFFVVEKCNA